VRFSASFLHKLVDPKYCRASDDLQNPDKLRFLLKDLREARQAKSRDGLDKIDHSELSVRLPHSSPTMTLEICCSQLPNLSSMEINEIRPFFVRSMGILTQLVGEPSAGLVDTS
jgi:GINS complex subunit 2